jgi:hypothetical protein
MQDETRFCSARNVSYWRILFEREFVAQRPLVQLTVRPASMGLQNQRQQCITPRAVAIKEFFHAVRHKQQRRLLLARACVREFRAILASIGLIG